MTRRICDIRWSATGLSAARILLACLFAAALLLGGESAVNPTNQAEAEGSGGEVKKLQVSHGEDAGYLGNSVAVSGDTAVVGAYWEDAGGTDAGAVYIYQRDQGGANNWGEVKKLTASDAQAYDQFGHSVAIDGDTVVVGATSEDGAGYDHGAAYVFQRDQGGVNNWGEVRKLNIPDPEDEDYFGYSVAVSGDTAVVGAPYEDGAGDNRGAAYVFGRNHGGANNWGDVKKLTASDAEDEDYFGYSVAISGDTAVVGAPYEDAGGWANGAAYVFQRDQGGAINWGEVKKLTASDAELLDYFGNSMAIDGDTVVVGARGEDGAGFERGAAYVFGRDEGGADNWGEVKKLAMTPGPEDWDNFGYSVAVSGDTVVVGWLLEDGAGSDRGAAYIFRQHQGGTNNWGEVKKLVASDAQNADYFGYSVAVSGDTAVVGAPYEDGPEVGGDRGAAYVFERDLGGTENWGEVKKLPTYDAGPYDYFGNSVAVSGDTAIIGAAGEGGPGFERGTAYVFGRDQGGEDNWGQVKKLTASDAEDGDGFGYSVAIDGDTVVVGAPQEDGAGSWRGAAYVFQRDQGGANNWGEVKKLTASDAEDEDYFGYSVAVSGDTAVVGAHWEDAGGSRAGAAYVFQRDQGGANNWGEVKKLLASDAQANDQFGYSVAVSVDTAVVGAFCEDGAGLCRGAAYVFARNQGGTNNWGEVKKLTASDAEDEDLFGYSVAIDGDTAVVGAIREDAAAYVAGAAYVFQRDQGGADNWGEVKKLLASDAQGVDEFGYSVAVSGDTAVVGAHFEDAGGAQAGAAYVFERTLGGEDNWGQANKLLAYDAQAEDEFGYSVAVSVDTVVVGAPGEDDAAYEAGAAYIFERGSGGTPSEDFDLSGTLYLTAHLDEESPNPTGLDDTFYCSSQLTQGPVEGGSADAIISIYPVDPWTITCPIDATGTGTFTSGGSEAPLRGSGGFNIDYSIYRLWWDGTIDGNHIAGAWTAYDVSETPAFWGTWEGTYTHYSSSYGGPTANTGVGHSYDPVNLATGNYILQETDISIASKGAPLALERSYNSRDATAGRLGSGWRDNFDLEIELTHPVEPDTSGVALTLGHGRQDYYAAIGDGTYTAPPGVFDVLERNGDGSFTLTTRDKRVLEFDSSGVLQSETDRNGNTTSFTYASGNLTTVTDDASGRSLTFTYDENDRITSVTDPLGRETSYTYDSYGNLVAVTKPSTPAGTQVTQYGYDTNHQMTTLTDPRGNVVTTNVYDDYKRVVEQTDALGETTTFEYQNGRTIETDARGSTTTHEYDSYQFETKVTDGEGGETTYTYDEFGNRDSTTDPLGRTTTSVYDSRGNLLTETDANRQPVGDPETGAQCDLSSGTGNGVDEDADTVADDGCPSAKYTYDGDDNLLSETDALGRTTTYTYDEDGNLLTATDPLDGVTTFTYDSAGQLLTSEDELGRTTAYAYDSYGNPTSATDALGGVTTNTYDMGGRLLSETDPLGRTTTYTYDDLDRLLTTTDALLGVTTIEYDQNGNPVSVTDANGHATSYTYDLGNRLTTVTDALAGVTTTTYDAVGNAVTETDANGNITTYEYDALNRLTTVTDALAGVTTTTYDAVGNVVTETDANGNITAYSHDALNRLIRVTDALAGVTTTTYDAVGNVLTVTDANGNTTAYSYDALNRISSVTDAEGNVTLTTYDAVGNVATRTDGNGSAISFTYDALNRIVGKSYPDQPAVSYTYDAVGNRLSMSDLTGTTGYEYDELDRIVTVTGADASTVDYSYDAVGNRLSMVYPDDKNVSYTYDDVDRLVSVTDWGARVTTYDYDPASNPTSTVRANGVQTARTYDALDRVLEIDHSNVGTLFNVTYTHDPVGNRLSRTDSFGAQTYSYDDVYRLTDVDYPSPSDQTYAYDPVGNRTQLVEAATTDYTYDDADRLLTAGISPYTFDNNGNQILEDNRSFAYDREDRLVQVADWISSPGTVCADANWDGTVDSGDLLAIANAFNVRAGSGAYEPVLDPRHDGVMNSGDLLLVSDHLLDQCSVVTANAHNADGLRIYRSEDGATERYVWDVVGDIPMILQTSSGVSYVQGVELLMEEQGGTATWYLQDDLGSTVALTDAAGAVTDTYEYDVFGRVRSSTGSSSPAFLFAGEQADSSGLIYLRARFYDPELGRFLSADPTGEREPTLYAYAQNNPLKYTDPTGEGLLSWIGKGLKMAAKALKKVLPEGLGWLSNVVDSVLVDVVFVILDVVEMAVVCAGTATATFATAGAAAGSMFWCAFEIASFGGGLAFDVLMRPDAGGGGSVAPVLPAVGPKPPAVGPGPSQGNELKNRQP